MESWFARAETAPAMICVLTKRIYAYRDKCFATQDYSAAIENMLLAITSLGYESCWYEGHITDDDRICDKMAKILNVHQNKCRIEGLLPNTVYHVMVSATEKSSLVGRAEIIVSTSGGDDSGSEEN